MFRRIHAAVLWHAGPDRSTLWKRLRAFTVDGSKLNLPRELVREGYAPPSPQAHCPQELLSCLYQIRRRLPCDFVAAGSCDEVVTMGPAGTVPLRLRLVKYAVHETPYVLGTTLLDAQLYPLAALAAPYHGLWSVKELYKISKGLLQLERIGPHASVGRWSMLDREAVVEQHAVLDASVWVSDKAVVRTGARVGENARIGTAADLGAQVAVGAAARVHSRVRIGATVRVGEQVRVCDAASVLPLAVVRANADIGRRARITQSAVVGTGCRVLHDAEVGRGARLGPDSAATAGQVIPTGCVYAPAIEARADPAVAPASAARVRRPLAAAARTG